MNKTEPRPAPCAAPAPPHGAGLRLSLAQLSPTLGNVAANLEMHLREIHKAEETDSDLVIFPELSLTGYFLRDLIPDVALRLPDHNGCAGSPELQELLAATHEVDAVVGCVIEDRNHLFYNASLYLSRGQVQHVHRKVYLPTYGMFDEARFFAAGDRFRTFELRSRHLHPAPMRAGILLCEDLWHPTAAATLARQGVDIIIGQSASPGRGVNGKTGQLGTAESYDAILTVNAQLHTAYMAFVNRAGSEEGLLFWGGSRVIGPNGICVKDPAGDQPETIVLDLDPHALRRARITNPLLRDERYDVVDSDARYSRERARD